jgi:hypothetical protein
VFESRRAGAPPASTEAAEPAPVAPSAPTPPPTRRSSVELDWSVFERAKKATPTIAPEALRSDK